MDHNPEWLTVSQVNACQTLAKVKEGDDVALYNHGDDDWTVGIVTKVDVYKDRSTRWNEKRVITVKPHDGTLVKAFYEMNVAEILFK